MWTLNQYPNIATALKVIGNPSARVHYSQFGEDCVLWRWLQLYKIQDNGFYVDIGCHHPIMSSNTYMLRTLRAWRGVNIDANPAIIELFERDCPDCINICAAVSDREEVLKFFIYNHPEISTIDAKTKLKNDSKPDCEVVREIELTTRRLENILSEIPEADSKIDLMSVDVEGADLSVLRSNNWQKYRPKFLLVETKDMRLDAVHENETFKFLKSVGYNLISHMFITSLYRAT